jgi:hypothetical protein
MRITQLRNATVIVAYEGHRILVDPMLAPQGALPPFKWLTGKRRRNPIVELPAEAPILLEQAGEPSLYIAGDAVLTDEVRSCVAERRPDVSVAPSGGAAMDLGSELIMDGEQMLTLAA